MARKTARRTILTLATATALLAIGGAVALRAQIREQWLLWQLDAASESERIAAAEALVELGSVRAIPRLARALGELGLEVEYDENGEIVFASRGETNLWIVAALVDLGRPAHDALEEVLAGKPPGFATAILYQLWAARDGDGESAPDPQRSRQAVAVAIAALERFAPADTPDLLDYRGNRDEVELDTEIKDLLDAARSSLGYSGHAADLLDRALRERSDVTRCFVLGALPDIWQHPAGLVPTLLGLVRTRDGRIAALAQHALGKLGPQGFVELVTALDGADEPARATIRRALHDCVDDSYRLDPTLEPRVITLLASHPEPRVRALAARFLGMSYLETAGGFRPLDAVLDPLLRALDDPSIDVRAAALRGAHEVIASALYDELDGARSARTRLRATIDAILADATSDPLLISTALEELAQRDRDQGAAAESATSLELLLAHLRHADAAVRAACAHALGVRAVNDATVIAALVESALSPHELERDATRVALRHVEHVHHSLVFLPALDRALASSDIERRRRALSLLVEYLEFDPMARRLIPLLRVEEPIELRRDAAHALLSLLDSNRRALRALLAAQEDADPEMRTLALGALVHDDTDDRSIAACANALAVGTARERQLVALAVLASWGGPAKDFDRRLLELLEVDDADLRHGAAHALAAAVLGTGHNFPLDLEDSVEPARLATIAERVARRLAAEPEPIVRRELARIAHTPELEDAPRNTLLELAARDSDPHVRADAAATLAEIARDDEHAATLLVQAAHDPSFLVRIAALRGFVHVDTLSIEMIAALRAALVDPRRALAEEALIVLAGKSRAAAHLLDELLSAMHDVTSTVRTAATHAVGGLVADDPPSLDAPDLERARTALEARADDPNEDVANAARHWLAFTQTAR